jgi:putative nucleotidyltransferase with HDIG domain
MPRIPLKPSAAYLRTRVARRVVLLFLLCALLPVTALAVFSYFRVSRQLHEQARERVVQAARNSAQALIERLGFIDRDLTAFLDGRDPYDEAAAAGRAVQQTAPVRGAIRQASGSSETLYGDPFAPPDLAPAQLEHLQRGYPLLVTAAQSGGAAVYMARAIRPGQPSSDIVWAEVSAAYVAVAGEDAAGLPYDMNLCLLGRDYSPIYCSRRVTATTIQTWRVGGSGDVPDRFDWRDDQGRFVAGAKEIPLAARSYGVPSPGWTLVLSEERATVLEPMTEFRDRFPWIILLTILAVAALANFQIRYSMDPLEKLQEGTRRIAQRDFGSRVEVASRDEFQDLAESFNAMAHRLGRQFNALTTINEIDRQVLSALDTEEIIETVVSRTRGVIECDVVALCLAQGSGVRAHWVLYASDSHGKGGTVRGLQLAPEEIEQLKDEPEFLYFSPEDLPSYLRDGPLAERAVGYFLALPIFLKQKLSGVIALGYRERPELSEEDLVQARQLADQVAVALSNARLIEELDQFNWGALAALAQTVDAKSPWTAGHSQRVTRLSLRVGRKMGLPAEQIDVLHRGGLLHDIGKIGVPATILDKPGSLSDEEMQTMRDHVTVGARILTPIAAYADMIPIVLRHHERMDGSGYPDGLVGEEIPFLARVLAVPDVFDALTSDRPYRQALAREKAIVFITEGTGHHFDMQVVEAFLAVMREPEPQVPEELARVFPQVTA